MVKNLICLDVETLDSRGASFEYYRKDFRIFSMSLAWREGSEIVHWFSTDPEEIKVKLEELASSQDQIVAHNLPFEYGVTQATHGVNLNWYADTMRLAQVCDGGGDEFSEPVLTMEQELEVELGELNDADIRKAWRKRNGLSLEACALRFLGDTDHEHKREAHQYLEENHGITKNHGQYLHLLPNDILRRYNNLDTRVTLLLYEHLTRELERLKYDWTRDHALYLKRAYLMSSAYAEGIKIDRSRLMKYIQQIEAEVEEMEQAFRSQFEPEIQKCQQKRLEQFVSKVKTEKGFHNRWLKFIEGDCPEAVFNIGSSTQLTMLFCEVLQMGAQFLTPKGAASFKSTHLHQWGKGGGILQTRKKRLLVLQQCVNTWILSHYDGRVHCSVKVSGTRTNRVSSGRV